MLLTSISDMEMHNTCIISVYIWRILCREMFECSPLLTDTKLPFTRKTSIKQHLWWRCPILKFTWRSWETCLMWTRQAKISTWEKMIREIQVWCVCVCLSVGLSFFSGSSGLPIAALKCIWSLNSLLYSNFGTNTLARRALQVSMTLSTHCMSTFMFRTSPPKNTTSSIVTDESWEMVEDCGFRALQDKVK